MNVKPHQWSLIAIIVLSPCIPTPPVFAQLNPDSTSNTQVITQPKQPHHKLIQGGYRVKGNLFHSFQDFSIPKRKDQVQFVLPSPGQVRNIFARVTGKIPSRINGTIASDGQANLFLINPNGISFQKNARFKIGGSFLGTTGDSIGFKNGQKFRAIAPQNTRLLTVKTPIGIQIGSNPGLIQQNNARLVVKPNQKFALIGGELQFRGRRIAAPNGTVVFGALEPNQTVALDLKNADTPLSFRQVKHFDNITFNNTASVTTLSDNQRTQGEIQLWGNNISLNNLVRLRSNQNAEIKIHASGTLSLDRQSRVITDTGALSTLGNIEIQAQNIVLKDGSQIKTSLTGTRTPDENRTGGRIQLRIQDRLLVDGISPKSRLSSGILSDGFLGAGGGLIDIEAPHIELVDGGLIRAEVFNDGQGGNIKILTDTLTLSSGSQISSKAVLPKNTGESGSVKIQANKRVSLTGSRILPGGQTLRQTSIRAEALGQGRAGSLEIFSPILEIFDGAQIVNSTTGKAGSSVFQIGDRLLISGIPNNISSGIFSDSLGQGIAGPIRIEAPQISLNDGGLIRSQVFAGGEGGDITINSDRLSIQNGSQISSSSTNRVEPGISGTLRLWVRDRIDLSGTIIPLKETRPSAIRAESVGNSVSGDIFLKTRQLNLKNGAQISNATAGTTERKTSGVINLKVNTLSLEGDNTQILAETNGQSPAGDITIHAQDNHPLKIAVQNRSRISASSSAETVGKSGTVTLKSPTLLAISGNGQIEAATSGSGAGGLIQVTSPTIQVKETLITSQSSGASKAGDIIFDGDILTLRDRATLSTSSTQGSGGNIQLNLKQLVWLSGASAIKTEAQANGGNISSTLSAQYRPWLIAPRNTGATLSANAGFKGGNIDLTPFRVLGFEIVSTPRQIVPAGINQISASGSTPIQNGNINANLVTNLLPRALPAPPVIAASTLSERCHSRTSPTKQSTFRSIGQGGMRPDQLGEEPRFLWEDIRSLDRSTAQYQPQTITPSTSPYPLEAQGWVQPQSGKIYLVASGGAGAGIASASPQKCDTVISTAYSPSNRFRRSQYNADSAKIVN